MTSFNTLAEDYLQGCGGSVSEYHSGLREGSRIGQSFFNALSAADKVRLVGTIHDPFYKNGLTAINDAIEFLLYH